MIVKERVPEMFSPRLAETILFMGKASKVLQLTGKVTARDHVTLATRLEHVFSTTAWQSIDLELKIDQLRHELATKMIAMLFKDYNLQGYFWTLKEFFMLTNGEFYLGFMNGAQKLLSGPLTSTHENGTRYFWPRAYGADDAIFRSQSRVPRFVAEIDHAARRARGPSIACQCRS